MKKLFGIFSLSILLFSTFAPSFTYANEVENLAKEILTEELENTGNELDNENNGNTTSTFEQEATLKTQEENIDWYGCFGITSESTNASVNRYNCTYEDIIIPGNIKYLNASVFSGARINSIKFLNNETKINSTVFSGAIIIGNVTLPGNQEYDELSALENIIVSETGILTVNRPTTISKAKNYGKIIIEGANGGSFGYLGNSLIDGEVIFSGFNNFTLQQSFINSTITEKGKIIFKKGITALNSCFSPSYTNNSVIEFEEAVNINGCFNNGNHRGLVLSGNLGVINGSIYGGLNNSLSGDLKVKNITNSSMEKYLLNGDLIVQPDSETNDILNSVFNEAIISGNVIISGNNKNFGSSNFNLATIKGDLTITGNNLYLKNGLGLQLTIVEGDFNINGKNITGEGIGNNMQVKKNLNIIGENLKFESGTFNGAVIGKNLNISGINAYVKNSGFGSIKIGENINIKINNFETNYGAFDNQIISGDVIINSNYFTGASSFTKENINGSLEIKSDSIYLDNQTFRNSNISGDVKLEGDIKTKKTTATSNYGEANFGEAKIGGDIILSGKNINLEEPSFFHTDTAGSIILQGNKIQTSQSAFADFSTKGDVLISGNYYTGTNGSFGRSKNDNVPFVGGSIIIKGGNLEMINSNFGNSQVGNNIIISGNNIKGNGSALFKTIVEGSIIVKGGNIEMANMIFYNGRIGENLVISGNNINTKGGALGQLSIKGNANIFGNNINVREGFILQSNISGDVKISGEIFTGESSIINTKTKIGGNLIINNNKTYLGYGAIDNSSISGDIIIESSSLNVYGGSMRNLTTEGDIIIKSNEINTKQEFLKDSKISGNVEIYSDQAEFGLYDFDNSKIDGNLKLPKNIAITDDNFNGLTIGKNLLLGGTKTNRPAKSTINGGIIIEDGDNALEELFTGITVGNNQVTINGTLSNIGAHAYSFKEGTRIINTITLSDDFNTGDIGDGAFCIQNESEIKVNAATTKRFTQEERQDLYDRTCINLAYSGTYNLLLKVDGREAIAVYDGIHEVEIPDGLKKSGYNIKWYLNPELTGAEVNLNNQSFEKYEYTKTIYGKYIEIPVTPAAGGGSTINPSKQESKTVDQEHNSADTEKSKNTTTDSVKSSNSTASENIKEQVVRVQQRSLTRGEVAVMSNILLDVYPQLTENRELNEVSEACENYADEQNFTKDEKKAITRLCKLSIMGIHNDNEKPLDEFMVNEITKNDEFSKVINRSLSTYTEKDFSTVKDALKKLEGDEENVVFGTVYDVFMSIKNIFN